MEIDVVIQLPNHEKMTLGRWTPMMPKCGPAIAEGDSGKQPVYAPR